MRVESPPDLDLTSRARGENADQRLTKVAGVYSAGEPRSHDHQSGEYCDRAYEPPANDRIIHGQINAQIRAPPVGMRLPSRSAGSPITATAPDEECALLHPSSRQRVIPDEEHRRPDDRNRHAIHIESGDAMHTERIE